MHELIKEQRRNVLSSLISIKEKWDGTVKCCLRSVNGVLQQNTIAKESVTSPTAAMDIVF